MGGGGSETAPSVFINDTKVTSSSLFPVIPSGGFTHSDAPSKHISQ